MSIANYSFVLLIFLFTTFPAMSETLFIDVLQKGSGDPVPGATVVIKQSGEYDTTDENGRLTFENIEMPVTVKILNMGYETLEQEVEKLKTVLYLEPLNIEVEAIEVVEERVKQKASKIVLQKEELRSVAGTQGDPIKMIESLPGVITKSGGGGAGGNDPNAIYVRGSSGAENSFWVNRLPVDYLYHVWGISVINPSLVENFNIFLGGFPVNYDDVLGGVIDIQLRKPKTDRLHQTYRVALNESAVLIEGPINERQSFYVAARASYIDKLLGPFINDISRALSDDETDISIVTLPKYWDAQANWHYEMPKGSVDLLYFGSNDGLAVDINKIDDADPDVLGRLSVDFGFHTLGLNTRRSFSSKLTGILTTSIKRGHSKFTIGSDDKGNPFGVDIVVNEGLIHPELIWNPKKNHELTFGITTSYGVYPVKLNIGSFPTEENNTQGSFTDTRKFEIDDTMRLVSSSPYINWRWSWNKLNTTFGLRYSKLRGSGGINMSGMSPRIGFEHQTTKKLLLTTSWGRYIQTPAPAQLLRKYGNPMLGYTEAEHRIVGAQYKFSDLWSVQTELYYKPMQKLVLTRPFEDPPNNYKNDGTGKAYGFDLLIKREYGNRKLGWLSYSYSKSKRTLIDGANRDFSADQPHALSLIWSQPFTGTWSKWSWGFKLQAGSGQPYTPVIGRIAMCDSGQGAEICPDQSVAKDDDNLSYWNPIFAERNILRRPFNHQLDVRIDRLIRYNTWTMKLYLDILNVTLQQGGVSDDYGKDYENYRTPKKVGGPGIPLPFLGVEATF